MDWYTDPHKKRRQRIFAVRIERTHHGGIRHQLNLAGYELVYILCKSTAATHAILQLDKLDHFLNINPIITNYFEVLIFVLLEMFSVIKYKRAGLADKKKS
ncbi:hypothetical protein T11_6054 [Trichinella zimbabwensis]|uniref:Uncharacterized protein n=1 Tax=Trichinella zimbabwensis TaxID=268475 RepID=A0A0V1H8M3_9BILA|nr:hypothetical protein T11_6054 [Trichinella zimbabwensis]